MPVDPRLLADSYSPSSMGQLWVPVLPKDKLALLSNEQLYKYHAARKKADELAKENPVAAGWKLPAWQGVLDGWKEYPIHVILGGVRCVRGDTRIYDPVKRVTRRIDSIRGAHHVLSWNGTSLVVAEASEPFKKGSGEMMRVVLSTGDSFVAAPEHRVLSADGRWLPCGMLRLGCVLFRPPTTSGTGPSGQRLSALHLNQTQSDSQSDCHSESRLCDAQPHSGAGICQDASPSQDGVPTHTSSCDTISQQHSFPGEGLQQCTLDGRDKTLEHSRAYLNSSHPSIRGEEAQDALRLNRAILSHASSQPCKSICELREDRPFFEKEQQSALDSCPQKQALSGSQSDTLSCYESPYVISLNWEACDVKWDITVASHGNYLAEGVIHHNSGKSTLASRLCVWALGNIPEAQLRCYHVNGDRSQQDQQKFIWDALPNKLQNLPVKKSFSHSIQYNQRTGFTNDMLILPPLQGWTRGGRIDFGNYKQWESDNRVTEGFKAHLIWCDETVPLGFFETILYRTPDFNGRIILTFTTIDGWTPLVQDILGRTRTIQSRYSHRLKRKLPTMQESLSRKGALIHYFWTEDNPWVGGDAFMKLLDGRPQDEILCRAYGIPTKTATAVFTKFDRTINVIKHEDLPFIKNKDYKVTRYMAIDPAGSKNWFMLWVAIDASNTWWVYRDWPSYEQYGAWAEAGPTIEGKPGPAQRSLGWGIKDYVDKIRELEDGEEIFERLIDPRMGNAEKQSANEGATTIISDLDKHDITAIPAPGVEIENGLQVIKDLLAWNEDKMRDSVNTPHLFVSDRCENFIHAMCEYTAKGGSNEATKDCIDPLRYLAVSGARFFAAEDMQKDYGTAM